MDKPDAPASPDYVGAANATSQGSVQAAIANALLNRSNQSTPIGSQTWEQTGTTTIPGTGTAATEGHWEDVPASGGGQPGTSVGGLGSATWGGSPVFPVGTGGSGRRWVPGTPASADYKAGTSIPQFSSKITLSPQEQAIFDQNQALRTRLTGAASDALSTPFDLSGLPSDYNKTVADAMYNRSTSMLDPQWDQTETRRRNSLLNSGFSVGDTGYTKAYQDFDRNKSAAYGDARDRATLLGAQQGQQDRQQAINEMLLKRNEPLQELAAANGSAPQIPNFGSTNVGANSQGADLLGATSAQAGANNDIYNAKMGNYNSTMGTVGGLAGMAGMLAAMAPAGSMFL